MTFRTRWIPLIVLAGMVLASGGSSRATLVQPLTLPELVQRSATIVYGTVQETHTAWEDGRARLYTYVTVAATEFLKGGAPDAKVVTFRQLGGRDGDQIVYVPGSPRFRVKQEVLLFLTGDDPSGFPQVMGIFQGAFRPASGPRGERRVEGVSPAAIASILPEKDKRGNEGAPSTPMEGSFADFLERIRSLVREQAAGPAR